MHDCTHAACILVAKLPTIMPGGKEPNVDPRNQACRTVKYCCTVSTGKNQQPRVRQVCMH